MTAHSDKTHAPPRRIVAQGEMSFICPQDSKPVLYSSALTGSIPTEFFTVEQHTISIEDLRDMAATPTLDSQGFELLRHKTAVDDLYDDAAIENEYIPELQALLRQHLGASRVVIFDLARRSDDGAGALNRDGLRRGPARRVHVDFTSKSGPERAIDVLGDAEVQRLMAAGARIRHLNIWRPIRGPVQRSPLVVADASTVRPQDLVATDHLFPNRTSEIYHLRYEPSQRWYFVPQMTPEQVLVIKGWDSLDDGRARFAPHGAVNLLETDLSAPPRESIETRVLVISNGESSS